MKYSIRKSGFDVVERAVKGLGISVANEESKKALRTASKITLAEMQSNVPVNPKKFWTPKSKIGNRAYERGGMLKQDSRIMMSRFRKGNATDISTVVGYSKKKDKVGWRAVFLVNGWNSVWGKRFIPKNDWIGEAGTKTISAVETAYFTDLKSRIGKLGL